MKQYLMSVYMVEGAPMPPPERIQEMYAAVDAFNAEVKAAGAWIFAGGLFPADVSTTVRHEGDDLVVTDGPFAESKEHIGGFWVIKAPDLDAALAWAKKGAKACGAAVEVRPFQDEAEE